MELNVWYYDPESGYEFEVVMEIYEYGTYVDGSGLVKDPELRLIYFEYVGADLKQHDGTDLPIDILEDIYKFATKEYWSLAQDNLVPVYK